jgi:hypothetical protein
MSTDFNFLQERNVQTLDDIQKLQDIENGFIMQLTVDKTLTIDQKRSILGKINEISQLRINLYNGLNTGNNYYQNNLSSSSDTLSQQTNAILIVEKQLNDAKKRLDGLNQEKTNKLRQIEINNYYSSWYDEHTKLIKLVTLILVLSMCVVLLGKYNIIPDFLYYTLMLIILVVGVYYFFVIFISIFSRDNMNYDEYIQYFDKKHAPPINTGVTGVDPWSMGLITCVGQQCCYKGSTYNMGANKCVPDPANS